MHTKTYTLLQTNTTSYRLIFGENDGFPSLIADVYDSVLVVELL
jgi:23S rRNA (cytosine1962-C5)-methyltransferase